MMTPPCTRILLALLLLPGSWVQAGVTAGYDESPASFVFSAYDPESGNTYYRDLNLVYLPFLQQPSGEINLAKDPAFKGFLGKPSVQFNVTAFAPLKEDRSNRDHWGVLVTSSRTAAGVDASWIGIDAIRQTLQVFYSYLSKDSGLIAAGTPGSFGSTEWSSTLLDRVPFETTGRPETPLAFYFLNNPSGDPKAGIVRKAGEWVLGLDGWLRFSPSGSLLENQPPIAEAGKDQRVLVGQAATLSGTQSSDPDESPAPLTYRWTQVAGFPVELASSQSVTIRFVANTLGTVSWRLTVFDGKNQGSDEVSVTAVNLLATFPSRFRRSRRPISAITFTVNGAVISPREIAILSYSPDGLEWKKAAQTPVKTGRLFFKPDKKASRRQPDGAGFLKICVRDHCEQAAITVIP